MNPIEDCESCIRIVTDKPDDRWEVKSNKEKFDDTFYIESNFRQFRGLGEYLYEFTVCPKRHRAIIRLPQHARIDVYQNPNYSALREFYVKTGRFRSTCYFDVVPAIRDARMAYLKKNGIPYVTCD